MLCKTPECYSATLFLFVTPAKMHYVVIFSFWWNIFPSFQDVTIQTKELYAIAMAGFDSHMWQEKLLFILSIFFLLLPDHVGPMVARHAFSYREKNENSFQFLHSTTRVRSRENCLAIVTNSPARPSWAQKCFVLLFLGLFFCTFDLPEVRFNLSWYSLKIDLLILGLLQIHV